MSRLYEPTTTAVTQAAGDNTTLIATDAFVTTAVANAIAGVNPAVAVQVATATVLPNSPTYNNGVSGVGATLTTASTNVALVVDGVTPALNDRVLVKDQASAFQNGVYFVSQLASVGLAWILTRALDYNQPSDMNSTGAIPVVSGTVNTTTSWVLTSKVTTVGTDALTFTEFTLNPTTLMTTTTYDPAGIAQQVVGTTASQTVSSKLLSDTFMGNTFQSLSATKRSAILAASTNFEVDDRLEIGSAFSLETPATSSLEIRVYPQQNTTNTLANKTLSSPLLTGAWDGWISSPTEVWTATSGSSFTISSASSISPIVKYTVGDKLRMVAPDGTTLYGYATSVGAVVVSMYGGTDYVLTSGLTYSVSYSHMVTPVGFPQWFNYTPNWTNLTVGTGPTQAGRFIMQGKQVVFNYNLKMGTSPSVSGDASLTIPITAANLVLGASQQHVGMGLVYDNNVTITTIFCTLASTTSLSVRVVRTDATYSTFANFSSTVPFTWAVNFVVSFEVTYESA